MSDDDEIQVLTEIERITDGKPRYLDMDAAFCALPDLTVSYQRQRNEE